MTLMMMTLLQSSPYYYVDSWWSSVVVPYGLTCLAAHILLVAIFKYVLPSPSSSSQSPPPWKTVPSFTAHQVVAFYLMISWTVSGIYYYYYYYDGSNGGSDSNTGDAQEETTTTPILKLFQVHDGGLLMAQRSMAALWVWDIPVMTFGIQKSPTDNSRADLIMHLHHVGMLLICCIMLGLLSYGGGDGPDGKDDGGGGGFVAVPIGSCYAPVFLGIVELSSVPLQVVDLFHPHKGQGHWYNYINNGNGNRQDGDHNEEHRFKSFLQNLNEICRQLFAVLFLMVRGIYFPYIVIGDVVPNTITAFRAVYPKYVVPLSITFVFSVGFTLLQMYWTVLVVQQILKALKKDQRQQREQPKSPTTKEEATAKVSNDGNETKEAQKKKS